MDPSARLRRRFKDQHRRIDRKDQGVVVCFLNLGPIIVHTEEALDDMVDESEKALVYCDTACKASWRWSFEDRPVWQLEDGELKSCPHPIRGSTIVDMNRYLWISFDDKADAMLARMAIIGLQGEHHAFGGRMS